MLWQLQWKVTRISQQQVFRALFKLVWFLHMFSSALHWQSDVTLEVKNSPKGTRRENPSPSERPRGFFEKHRVATSLSEVNVEAGCPADFTNMSRRFLMLKHQKKSFSYAACFWKLRRCVEWSKHWSVGCLMSTTGNAFRKQWDKVFSSRPARALVWLRGPFVQWWQLQDGSAVNPVKEPHWPVRKHGKQMDKTRFWSPEVKYVDDIFSALTVHKQKHVNVQQFIKSKFLNMQVEFSIVSKEYFCCRHSHGCLLQMFGQACDCSFEGSDGATSMKEVPWGLQVT